MNQRKGQHLSERDVDMQNRVRGAPASEVSTTSSNRELKRIRSWLKQVRFKKALFGVSEADVWKRIAELNGLYEVMLKAERARYDALLEDRIRAFYKKLSGVSPSIDDAKYSEVGDDV